MNIADFALSLKSVWRVVLGLSLIWRVLLALLVAFATIEAGWKPVRALYDWCLDNYHGKILRVMMEVKRNAHLQHPNENIVLLPFPLADIAKAANRSQKRTHWSLRALEAKGKVKEIKNGWVLTSS